MKLPGSRVIASSENLKTIVGTWAIALLWCGFSFPMFYILAFDVRSLSGGLIGGLLSVFGVAILWHAFRITASYGRLGAVTFTLQSENVRAGARMEAIVELAADAVEATAIDATLECKRVTWMRGARGHTSVREQSAWALRKTFPLRPAVRGASALIMFDIPSGASPSDLPDDVDGRFDDVTDFSGIEFGRVYHRWEIRVTAQVPGVDLERTFCVRVVPAPGQAPAAAAPRVDPAIAARPDPTEAAASAARRRIVLLGGACAIVPLVVIVGIVAIAGGLADCPPAWRDGHSPACVWAGINWGPAREWLFDWLSYIVSGGFVAAVLVIVVGNLRIYLREAGERKLTDHSKKILAAIAIFVGIIAINIYGTRHFAEVRERRNLAEQAAQAAARAVRWTTQTAGWFLPLPEQSGYAAAAGRGLRVGRKGDGLHVTFDRIVLEKRPDQGDLDIESIALRVSQDTGQTTKGGGSMGGMSGAASRRLEGALTADAPAMTLENYEFTIAGAGVCLSAPCSYQLQVFVRTPDGRVVGQGGSWGRR